ncbi:hypothetical protein BDY19DRAFT_992194 [Irpex rosettiformis]|uniref:Uncharacterized protein n=1 Tax=Irpex rosettiformis TaxID=378272 RepID=A0ACB8U8Y4_9APHY|nr:hypothetical protein BDY19DRAFT_992194 [Irpex rosettiformis]
MKITSNYTVAPPLDDMRVPIELQAIYVEGLRERLVHTKGDAFVEVSVVGEESGKKFKTGVSPASTAPSWSFNEAIILAVWPSSIIRFTVYRHHRILKEEIIGVIEGTTWTFISNGDNLVFPNTPSKDSPNMSLRVSMRISDADHKSIKQKCTKNLLRCGGFRLVTLNRLYGERVGNLVQGPTVEALKTLGTICSVLDVMSDTPLCKVAGTLLRLVRVGLTEMFKKREEIDERMSPLLKLLLEVVSNAFHSEQDLLTEEVIYLAGYCADILDSWVRCDLKARPIQFVIGASDDRLKAFHEQASELKAKSMLSNPQTNTDHAIDLNPQRLQTLSSEDDDTPHTPPPIYEELDESQVSTRSDSEQGDMQEFWEEAMPPMYQPKYTWADTITQVCSATA